MKKITSTIISYIIISLFLAVPAFAQTSATEKVINDVKESVGELIGARDTNSSKESNLRLETYKKVLELSIEDAKETKLKLLAFEEGKKTTTTLTLWKNAKLKALNSAIKYYENEFVEVMDIEYPTMEGIKYRAEELKKWREEVYIPLSKEIQGFIFIELQKQTIETTEKRFEKVSADVDKLREIKFKDIEFIEERLETARKLIDKSIAINNDAEKLFKKRYLIKFMKDDNEEKISLLKEIEKEKKREDYAQISQTSIKDLVDNSFTQVKDVYQIFIEMSNSVRGLF